MMTACSRRKFLGYGTAISSVANETLAAAARPTLAIAHYRSSPQAPDGIAEEARRLTIQAIAALGGMGRFVSRGDVVWVKPNIGWNRRPEQAATTNPDVVATLVSLCYQAGAKRVIVSDNSCNPAPASFARSGIQQAAQKAGADAFIPDERKYRKMALNGAVLHEWAMYADLTGVNKLINVPIVKHHGLCKATLGMKNLMGVAGGERNRFHQDLNNTLVDLAAFLHPVLVVMDGIRVLAANGPVGGNLADVRRKDVVAASADQVAADAFGATLLGRQPQEIGYIVEASRRRLGTMDFVSLKPVRLEL
jgi:uncharacterized protein (DUF362 family)